MRKPSLTVIALLGLFLALCAGCGEDKPCSVECVQPAPGAKEPPVIRLQQQWYANSGFAGELVAAKLAPEMHGIQIVVVPGSDNVDTRQVVAMGDAHFGVASADQIMQANENVNRFVVVGVINPRSLVCFISKPDSQIDTPKDFVGKRIGTMEGSPVDFVYRALLDTVKVKPSQLAQEVPTGWNYNGFIAGDYDVYPAFINDEPITLRRKGVPVNVIDPGHYGVNFIGTVYFCKKELAQCCPEMVQAFIDAIGDGWKQAFRDKAGAMATLKAYDSSIDVEKELESLRTGESYHFGPNGQLLLSSEGTWKAMAAHLKPLGIEHFNYDSCVDMRFVNWYLRDEQ